MRWTAPGSDTKRGGKARLSARRVAADHGVWVAVAAFAGPTGGGFDRTSGRSGIWSAAGALLAEASAAPDDITRAVIPRRRYLICRRPSAPAARWLVTRRTDSSAPAGALPQPSDGPEVSREYPLK